MSFLSGRVGARRLSLAACLLGLSAAATLPAKAESGDATALDLHAAANLAVTAQPLLQGLDAQARAARESAIAARQLPDPQLLAGIADLPSSTGDAWSFTRDTDTQIQVGVMQEFPRAAKRRLRGELSEREALRLDAEHHLAQRTVRREAALAWLEVWRYDQTLRLTQSSLREARVQQDAVEIALKTGSATQAEFLAARLEADRLVDAEAAAEQGVAHARNALSRWIGDSAFAPLSSNLPPMPALPALETALERVRQHPHLAGAAAQVGAAQTSAALARAGYSPDWRMELGYGYRPAFSEMVTLQVGMDLPVFTRNRQDRGLASALAQEEAAEFAVEDASRQLQAEARLNHHDYARLGTRLDVYDSGLLPQSRNRVAAALAGWRSGRGMLRDVLDARRSVLELQMARLDLQLDLAKHYIQLSYLGVFDDASNAGENSHE